MIQSLVDKDTQELFNQENSRRFNSISRVALRKLIQMNQAAALYDLAVPPGNRLEALKETLRVTIRSESTTNGVSFSFGLNTVQPMLKFVIIIDAPL